MEHSGDGFDSHQGDGDGGGDCKTNLIVNYLPQTMTEANLYSMFVTIGPIQSCRIMKDFKSGYSYGFGFVNYSHEADAARAIESFNGYRLKNKTLKVSYARPSSEDIKDTNLYVTNLPRNITDEQLDALFGRFGRIVQKHVLRDKKSGAARGVAFVRFDRREQAQEAITALNNVVPEGGTEPLRVKVAEEHGKQKAAYYAGWAAGYHYNYGGLCNYMMAEDLWDRFPALHLAPRSGARRPPLSPDNLQNFLHRACPPRPTKTPKYPPWTPGFGGMRYGAGTHSF